MTAWTNSTPTDEVRYAYKTWNSSYTWTIRNPRLGGKVKVHPDDSFPFLKIALICRMVDNGNDSLD